MSPVKEPTFFCEGFQVVTNPIAYFSLFDSVDSELVIGEASHAYLTNPSTAPVLYALFPEAKFVVIFRNPADRAYSLYHLMRRTGFEYASTFERALRLEEKRVQSPKFQTKCPHYYYNFLYFRSGLYGEQIGRYLSLFNKNQFHFITLDQLQLHPYDTIKSILRFLNLNSDFRPKILVHNKGNLTAKIPAIQYLWRTKLIRPVIVHNMVMRLLDKLNLSAVPPIRSETKHILMNRYECDLEKLFDQTGIDFNTSQDTHSES